MLKLAIVGTGGMANAHADSFKRIPGCQLVAACDVVPERAAAFAEKHGISATFDDAGKMLRAVECDAVSVVTSDAGHAPISLKCIAAGKHVLCEKPLATNYADAKKMADAAKRKGVVNMVNLSYRNSSAIHRVSELIAKGEIGRVLHFEAAYLQGWLATKAWGDWSKGDPGWLWRLSSKLGSKGVLGDLGVHILDFMSYAAGDIAKVNCTLKTFEKVKGNKIKGYTLDANDSAAIIVELANGAMGVVHTTRWATGHANTITLSVHGDKGAVRINLDKSYQEYEISAGKDIRVHKWRTVQCAVTPSIYERFVRSIRTGKNDQPDFARGAAIQKALDACFDSNGRVVKV